MISTLFENTLQEEENKYNELQSSHNNLQIELERIKGEVQNKRSLLTKSNETKISLTSSIERLNNDIKIAKDEIDSISL